MNRNANRALQSLAKDRDCTSWPGVAILGEAYPMEEANTLYIYITKDGIIKTIMRTSDEDEIRKVLPEFHKQQKMHKAPAQTRKAA